MRALDQQVNIEYTFDVLHLTHSYFTWIWYGAVRLLVWRYCLINDVCYGRPILNQTIQQIGSYADDVMRWQYFWVVAESKGFYLSSDLTKTNHTIHVKFVWIKGEKISLIVGISGNCRWAKTRGFLFMIRARLLIIEGQYHWLRSEDGCN